MGEQLIKPYQISVWEDRLIESGGESHYEEVKIAEIGSDTMTSQNRVYSPVFKVNTNGEKTLTFSLKYKYYDELVGDFVVNPFERFLVNERKIKLFYKNEWHDFVIKEKEEESEEYTFSYTCTDLFVQELAKNGYGVTFNSELNNNQGTVTELAAKTLENTDWTVDEENSDLIQQTVSEPIYECTVSDASFTALNTETQEIVTIEPNEKIYIFYSFLQNKITEDVQFLREVDQDSWSYDNNDAIVGTNYRLLEPVNYDQLETSHQIAYGSAAINVGSLSTEHQGHRLVYNILSTYDSVMGKTVDKYRLTHSDGHTQDIYHYTTSHYETTAVVQSYVTNGSNYTISNTGGINGWSNMVDTKSNVLLDVGLVTYPKTDLNSLAKISELKQMKGYLKLEFPGTSESYSDYPYPYAFFNSGITDNAGFIGGIAGGDKFVLRYRYQWSNIEHEEYEDPEDSEELEELEEPEESEESETLNKPSNDSWVRAVVAGYTSETKTLEDDSKVLVRRIDTNKIYIDFKDDFLDGTIHVTGGTIVDNNYIIDNVIQTPSDKYVYDVDNGTDQPTEYIWNVESSSFEERTDENFVSYYYTIAEVKKSISAEKLSDPANRIGIFIYNDNESDQYVYIEDIEITRYYEDAKNKPIFIGSAPEAKVETLNHFYLKPEAGATPGSVELYNSLESLASTYNFNLDNIKPLKNQNSEKILSIEAAKSNCFNILQDLCETFECWMKIEVEHDSIGRLKLDENYRPNKKVVFKKYVGKENFAGFRYGVNLTSITRSIDSNEFVTKLIVGQPVSEYTAKGVLNIGEANSNPSGESYILNFNYYLNQGLIENKEAFNQDLNDFNEALKTKNIELNNLNDEYVAASNALQHLNSTRNVYVEAAEVASDHYSRALSDFETATGKSYSDFALTEGDTKNDDALNKLVNEIYSTAILVNNCTGLLTNLNQEYKALDLKVNGAKTYNVTVTTYTPTIGELVNTTTLITSDYFEGLICTFSDDGGENNEPITAHWQSTINDNEFKENILYTHVTIMGIPENYEIEYTSHGSTIRTALNAPVTLDITEDGSGATRSFRLVPTEEYEQQYVGLKQQIETKLEEKNQIEKDFYAKYSRFIQEGTWESTNYIDNELYYMDALQVSNVSAQPKVSYTINVIEVSELEGLHNYDFNVGDRTYIEDTDFFGWTHYEASSGDAVFTDTINVDTPVKENVVVSEVEWHLDEPDANTITVQNYKTQFEDLFQRISATVQSVEYNQAAYMRAASILDSNGHINPTLLIGSLNAVAGQGFNLTSNGTLKITDDGIVVRNLTDPGNLLIIKNRGIEKSNDGGLTWSNLVSPEGINTDVLTAGAINTRNITILDGDNPSFRWDSNGISAFDYTNGTYDLSTYVRFDRYGLYGVQNGADYVASSLDDIKDQASFGLTWDGFFIKNKYRDGYVSISSTDDFQVVANDIERIKIGKFNDTDEYGIRIKNNDGDIVFESDDSGDISMSGTIRAAAGEIGGFNITDNALLSGPIGGAHSVLVSPGYYTSIPIAEASGERNWAIAVSNTFGVDTDGHLYATAANIQGNIYAENGYFSGHVDATSGTFMNELQVGGGDKYIVLQGYSDRPDSLIASSDYIDNPNAGWAISGSGDAIFNNVSVRGTIKTAVFEYSEIEAVGGAFLFRPSTAIKEARISGNDLVLKLENPNLFQVNEWVKLSNINTKTVNTSDGGLTHVYKIKSISGKVVVLENAALDFEVGPTEEEYDSWGSVDYGYEPTVFSSEEAEINPHEIGLYELIEEEYILTQDIEIIEGKTYYSLYYPAYSIVIFGQPDNYVDLTVDNRPILLDAPVYEIYFNGREYLKNQVETDGEVTVAISDNVTGESWNYTIQKYIGNLGIFSLDFKDTGEDFLIAQVIEVYKENNESQEVTTAYTRIYSNIQGDISLVITPRDRQDTVESLEGGSLISFGFDSQNVKYEGGIHNYGIGINSSDDYINLPERAISLFESEIHPSDVVKVSYDFRGILGTLPEMDSTGPSPQVSPLYNTYMQGTQGIYTDNMYIGDSSSYLAFYKENNQRKLRISGADIYLTAADEQSGTTIADVIDTIEAGEGLILVITSNKGTTFDNSNIDTTLTAHLYKDGEEVVPESGSQQTPEQVINELGYQINWYTYREDNSTHEQVEDLIKSNSVTCNIGTEVTDDISAIDSINIVAKLEDIPNLGG